MKRILVVDGDTGVRARIAKHARMEGYDVTEAGDGETALSLSRQQNAFDLMVLAVNLPGMDGFTVLKAVRTFSAIPVLILSSKNTAEDRIHGLELGADDYVTKPFSLAVLLAKTEALIRRSRGGGAETLACGAITLEPGRRACTVGDRLVALPPREYELLLCLMRNKGQVLRREQLLDKVWGIDFEGGDRAVDGRIKVLRAALGPAGKQIRTVFKVGYKLEGEQHGAD